MEAALDKAGIVHQDQGGGRYGMESV